MHLGWTNKFLIIIDDTIFVLFERKDADPRLSVYGILFCVVSRQNAKLQVTYLNTSHYVHVTLRAVLIVKLIKPLLKLYISDIHTFFTWIGEHKHLKHNAILFVEILDEFCLCEHFMAIIGE